MSTSESIRATTQIPQPVRNSTHMPTAFPDLPVDIFTGDAAKRKVAAEKWNATVRSWWKTARMAIESDYEELSSGSNIAINKSNSLSTALRTEVLARNDGDVSLLGQIGTIAQSSNGPNRIFLQTTEPATPTIGDLWYQIEIVEGVPKIRPWYYDGVAWQDVRDSAVADAVVAVSTEQTTRLNADSALGTRIDSINTVLNNETTGLTAQSTAINAVSAAVSNEETGLVAQSNRIGALESTVGDADNGLVATVNRIESTFVTVTGAGAAATSAITAQLDVGGSIRGAISTLDEKVFVGDESLASRVTGLESASGGNLNLLTARVKTVEDTYVTDDEAKAYKSEAISSADAFTNQEVGKKNKTFRKNSPPQVANDKQVDGDLWINPSDSNKISRWNGSAWEACEDTRVSTLSATVSTISTSYVSKTAATGIISTEISAALTGQGQIRSAINIEAQARADADGFLSGKYTLEVSAGGVVTGMRLTSKYDNGTYQAEVNFQADRFLITNSTGMVTAIPFEVIDSTVYMNQAMIKELSAEKIMAGTIAAVTVTSATINGGTITGTKIQSYNPSTGYYATMDGGKITGAEIVGGSISGTSMTLGSLGANQATLSALEAGVRGSSRSTTKFDCFGRSQFSGDVVIGRAQTVYDLDDGRLFVRHIEACGTSTIDFADNVDIPRVLIRSSINPSVRAWIDVRGDNSGDRTTIEAGTVQTVNLRASTARFGTYSAGGGTVSGYITITDSGGTPRKLAVIP